MWYLILQIADPGSSPQEKAAMSFRTNRVATLAVIGLLAAFEPAQSQDAQNADTLAAKRTQANELYERGRHADALPLLEELAKAFPDDMLLFEQYGVSLYTASATLPDPEAARRMRADAKRALTRSIQLGNRSPRAQLADSMSADGSMPPFSRNPEAEAAMQAGEASFGKGDFNGAIVHYQKALAVDPFNYNATLFIGDSYYRQNDVDRAGEWFARAITIDPNQETAYRYWGDALMRAKRMPEARARFMDAIIAEPYGRNAWQGFIAWAQAAGVRLGRPNLRPPAEVEKTTTGAAITLDPAWMERAKNDAALAPWMIYALTRAHWQTGEFTKRFPNEPAYRHSLAEEIDAYSQVLNAADEAVASGKPVTDPQIGLLRTLRDRNLLEPYILLHAAAAGIARDYPRYRTEHRDRILAYLETLILPR